MSDTKYLDYDEVLDVYVKTIEHSGGGFYGIRDKDAINSVLDFIRNDDFYPSFNKSLHSLSVAFVPAIILMTETSVSL